MTFSRALVQILLANIVVGKTSAWSFDNATASTACGTISTLQGHGETSFPADIARDCLRSVPLDVSGDALQVKGLRTLLEFQATLAYLKSPPPGYYYPAIDVLGSLDALRDRLNASYYDTEYDFQRDVYGIIRAAHDVHLFYVPDIIGLFTFERQLDGVPYQIYSVSEDGISLPNIYAFKDQDALAHGNASHYVPSPITTIDGQEVESYLNGLAAYEPLGVGFIFQDPDASYNALFPNLPNSIARNDQPIIGDLFPRNYTYSGNITSIGFANGTIQQVPIVATTTQDFSNITSGEDLFALFCNRTLDIEQLKEEFAPSSSTSATATSTPSTRVPYAPIPTDDVPKQDQLPTYPRPIAIASDRSIAGYFPTTQYTDLVVLAIPIYGPANNVEFENIVREVLATAASYNKTKLIIDLRGNGGGTVSVLYDTFKQLFPSKTPYGATNDRASSLLNDFGQSVSAYFDRNQDAVLGSDSSERGYYNPYDYHLELNANNESFRSWKELFGPYAAHGDNFTSLLRYNLSDPFSTQQPVDDVYGYGNNTNPQPQTFQPGNIVLLQDGTCSSACALFTELMKSQGNVQQIVVGGRKQYGPMQGVGGTKGAEQFLSSMVVGGFYAAYIDALPSVQAYFNETYGGLDGWFIESTGKALARVAVEPFNSSLNLRNNIRENDTTLTPLQFVYEAADCRFFYTPAMYSSQEAVWNKAYELMWENGTCVRGSTGQPSSEPGIGYILSPFPSALQTWNTPDHSSR